MYKIKQLPEDFIVDEQFILKDPSSGFYSYWLLRKRNLSTLDAVQKIGDALHLSVKFIRYSGNKDKLALTSQLISIYRMSIEKIKGLNLQDITLEYLENFDEPVFLGMHQGNKFKIVVRNLDHPIEPKEKIPNLFGSQRFSLSNVEIGRSIIRQDFKKAVQLLQGSNYESVHRQLKKDPMNYIGAIRTLPTSLLKLYIHSYQSFIWNDTVKRLLEHSPDSKQQPIPILGFSTELDVSFVSGIVKEIMLIEDITPRSFIIRPLPEISVEGGSRMLYMDVSNLSIGSFEDDELNLGKSKSQLEFILGKGSYATVLIDFLCR